MTITGGTYGISTGIATFTNNTGGTFNVSGFLTGMTDTYTTGFTYSNNTLTIKRNVGQPDLSVMINSMTGLTVVGAISATTFYGNGSNLTGLVTQDTVVTGGTYNSGSILFTNNTGGTFNVSGLYTGYTVPIDVYTTGTTYSNNTFTYTNNTGGTYSTLFNTVTGLTINGNLNVTGDTMTGSLYSPSISATTISATTYYNLPPATFTGGTVTGPTNFTNGLTANTMSATTYYGDGSNLTGISAVATEFVVNCRNQSGSDMYRGQVVYMNGSTGNKPTILLAQANSEMTSARTFGVLKNNIANNANGDVVTIGSITNLDTRTSATHPFTIDTLSDGQTIYLSPTNAGYITNVKPYAPNHLVYIGKVVRTSPTNGYIEYQIQNGYELDELHDVKITGETYGDLLSYSAYNGSNVWVNSKTLNGSYTITGDTTVGGQMNATSVSATTYYNLPTDVRVTGGTYSSGTATFTNNTGGTFTVTGFSTGGGTFTGGTVTGATSFTGGLTTSTISATTYYNLPTDVIVTGGTYSDGTTIFTNNTGGTFNITGYYTGYTAPLDVFVTGGTYSNGSLLFTNNTGGTFNVNTSTNYAAGVISGATYTSTGTGQINLPAIKVALYNNANNIEPIIVYDVASGTTGSGGIPSLVDQDTNYVVVEYNGGSPRYYVYDNDGMVDDSSTVLFMVAYRATNFVHTLEFGNQGAGLANKLNDRFIMTDRFGYESGLALSLSASTGIVMTSAGVAWNGPNRQSLTAVDSSGSTFFKNYHSGGTWTYTTTGETINNTYYDNGTNIVSATASKYLTNWYFRGQEINSHLYEVYSTSEYDSVALAQLATEPSLPELITSHAILLGRIIVEVGATTGLTESAFGTVFQSTQVTSHNDLFGLQGGSAGQYYHLNSNQYNNLALTNIDNIFGTGQSFISGLTANTISATTYYNLPIDVYVTGFTYDNANTFTITNNTGGTLTTTVNTMTGLTVDGTVTATNLVGDGAGITNIPIPYGLINAISSGNFLI
jgi:hypothetical protein